MEKIHKDCIRKNLVMLCEKLTPEPLHSHLMADGIFNEISMQYIKAPKVQFEQNQKLCLDLMKKGPNAFDKFVQCLFKSNLEPIGERLLVCEHNYRHRTNLTNFRQLPPTRQEKYKALADSQDNYTRMAPPPVPVPRGVQDRLQGTNVAAAAGGPRSSGPVTHPESDPHNYEATGVSRNFRSNGYALAVARDKDDVYPMDTSPRGLMLIINNKTFPRFPEKARERKGTNIDAEKLYGMFISYGFDVTRKNDLNAQEIEETIIEFKFKPELRRVSCVIVAILSHGKSDGNTELIYGTDGIPNCETNEGTVSLSWIFKQFNAANCPALIDKPKWFIVQACRGNKPDEGQVVADALPSPGGSMGVASGAAAMEEETVRRFGELFLRDVESLRKIPTEQDCLIAYATFPGYYSWRHTIRGSWFIQGLCETIEKYVHEEDVLTMLVRVNRKVASYRDTTNSRKQIPQPVFTLIKKWFLNPIPVHMVPCQ